MRPAPGLVWKTRRAGPDLVWVSMIANRIEHADGADVDEHLGGGHERRADEDVDAGQRREADDHGQAGADDVAHVTTTRPETIISVPSDAKRTSSQEPPPMRKTRMPGVVMIAPAMAAAMR